MQDIMSIGIGLRRAATVAVGLAVAAMVVSAAPAQAAKGWQFKETLGVAEKPKFGSDKSLAVDSAERLLVLDVSGGSLSRWNPDGTPAPFPALDINVIDGKRAGAVNECPVVPADCDETPGNAGIGSNQIAVDSSGTVTHGNIYVVRRGSIADPGWIDIFSGEGEFLGRLTATGGVCLGRTFGGLRGVAVDGTGNVYFSGFVDNDPGPGTFAVAIIAKYEPAANPPVDDDCVAEHEVAVEETLAAGAGPTDGHLFLPVAGNIGKRDTANPTFGTLRYEFGNSGVVSVEPVTGHVFNTSGSRVFEHDASGAEEAVEVARLENAGSEVHAITPAAEGELLYVGTAGSEEVSVYEAVAVPEPIVDPPSSISGAKATANGTVNPEGAEVTECFFEYGRTKSYGEEVGCEEYESGGVWQQLVDPSELGTGFAPVPVRGELTSLLAQGAIHHYRLVAGGVDGKANSDDEEFKTKDTYFTDPASGISESQATLNGTVKLEGVALTDCRFEWGETTEYGQSEPCDQDPGSIPTDDADHPVTAQLSGLEPSTIYHFRLVVENGLGQIVAGDQTFATQGAPRVEAQIASALGQTTATLQARINPFGSATSYRFQYTTQAEFKANGYANAASVPVPDGEAGSGSEPVTVSADVSGLEPASAYVFRLVAGNSFDTTEGPDQLFQTLNEHGLPDDRGFELVTPADKGASGSVVGGFGVSGSPRAAEDGKSFLWPLQNGVPESTAGGWTRWHAERGEEGWLSTQISSPSLSPPPEVDGFGFAFPSQVLYSADDLRCGVLATTDPVTASTPQGSVELGVENLYVWRMGAGEIPFRLPESGEISYRSARGGEIGYELISDRVPLNPAVNPTSGNRYFQIEAADDCSRVYFRSAYELIPGVSGLYEWDEGTLRDAGRLPDGSVGEELLEDFSNTVGPAVPGAEMNSGLPTGFSGTGRWNAVSPDGRRLFFTAIANEGPSAGTPAIFMRENGGASVTEISASETGVPTSGARFETASPDGSRVFFRANYGIDAGASSAGPTNEPCGPQGSETARVGSPPLEDTPCDLYVYDVATDELTDLSAETDAPGTQIQGVVAVDEDGSHVYFAALGQLVEGEGRTYAQNLTADSANVFLADEGGLSYVTTLGQGSSEDLFSGATMRTNNGVAGEWTAKSSADGGRLLFAATSRQSWYEGGGGKVAYLYSAETGEIACVSCRPDGLPTLVGPDGSFDPRGNASERLLATPDNRSLSADGRRVFFVSPDVLMPGAESGKRNVYEWHEGQLYFLAIAELGDGFLIPPLAQYLDASAGGDAAFLATDKQLAPQDRDFVTDVYALPVGGGFPLVEPPEECQVDESIPLKPNQIYCQGERIAQPTPPVGAYPMDGNVKRKCPEGKLRRGKRCLSKHQLAQRRCRKVKGKEASRRCVRKQLRRLNRAERRSGRAANHNRGGDK